MHQTVRMIIISGRSGSGKSTALTALEDQGFYCVDNLPASLLTHLVASFNTQPNDAPDTIAVSIDARNMSDELKSFSKVHSNILAHQGMACDVIYLDADLQTLLKRFSSTRRRHPLSDGQSSLTEAINKEAHVLSQISVAADLRVDTSHLSPHDLRRVIQQRVAMGKPHQLNLLFQSFGFKKGPPLDADFVFDVRCLPNPYWEERLRPYTGVDRPIIEFLEQREVVSQMLQDITRFVMQWLPLFEQSRRSYLTVAIGCTGGQHRSVYISEALGKRFRDRVAHLQVRHRELLIDG